MPIRFNLNDLTPDQAAAALRDLKRSDKAAEIPIHYIKEIAPDFYEVRSQSNGKTYQVDLRGQGSCTCPDWTFRGGECKHIKLARTARMRGENE